MMPRTGMSKQDAARPPGASTAEVFAGGGELGRLMTAMDWSATALGPVEHWPRALVTAVRIILTSRQPMFVRSCSTSASTRETPCPWATGSRCTPLSGG